MRKLSKEAKDKVICPGCSWVGSIAKLTNKYGACPSCGYENGAPPFRLPTLGEMLESDEETGYVNVRLDLFLKAFLHVLKLETN